MRKSNKYERAIMEKSNRKRTPFQQVKKPDLSVKENSDKLSFFFQK